MNKCVTCGKDYAIYANASVGESMGGTWLGAMCSECHAELCSVSTDGKRCECGHYFGTVKGASLRCKCGKVHQNAGRPQ